jgi:hypothetical protein
MLGDRPDAGDPSRTNNPAIDQVRAATRETLVGGGRQPSALRSRRRTRDRAGWIMR